MLVIALGNGAKIRLRGCDLRHRLASIGVGHESRVRLPSGDARDGLRSVGVERRQLGLKRAAVSQLAAVQTHHPVACRQRAQDIQASE